VKHWNQEHAASADAAGAARRKARAVALPISRRTLTFGPLYFWYILLATLDLLTTVLILSMGGREANGIADMVLQAAGPVGLLIMKYATVALVVCICEFVAERRHAAGRFVALAAIVLSAVPVAAGWAQLALHA